MQGGMAGVLWGAPESCKTGQCDVTGRAAKVSDTSASERYRVESQVLKSAICTSRWFVDRSILVAFSPHLMPSRMSE